MRKTYFGRLLTWAFGIVCILSAWLLPVTAAAQNGKTTKAGDDARVKDSIEQVKKFYEEEARQKHELLNLYGERADSVQRETYIYKIVGTDTLYLDIYYVLRDAFYGNQRAFIYSFGGAWEGGQRQNGAFLEDMAKQGFIGVAIDYRLGIKKMKEAKKQGKTMFKGENPYVASIRMALEDLYDATTFCQVLFSTRMFKVRKYYVSGSSAGAINSLTAEYLICQNDTLATNHLLPHFNYDGVVSFAGGIWTLGDTLKWKRKPCPVISFHGTDDRLVPIRYKHDDNFNASAFGPEYFMPQLKKMNVSHILNRFSEANHEIAILAEWGRAEYVPLVIKQIKEMEKAWHTVDKTNDYPKGAFKMNKPGPPREFPETPFSKIDKVGYYYYIKEYIQLLKQQTK